MNKAITYSLFKGNSSECHGFESFMRFLTVTLRSHHALFPSFTFVLNVNGVLINEYSNLFNELPLQLKAYNTEPLCRSMLWRIDNIYNTDNDYIFCRDIDSIPTYRERQAVDQFIKSGCTAHGINDSVSHSIPMMGGMIGFNVKKFKKIYPEEQYKKDLAECGINFSVKGSDQAFIMRYIFPKIKTDFFSHKILGMDCNNDKHCTNVIQDSVVEDIPKSLKLANSVSNHIGQGGYFLDPTFNELIPKHFPGGYNFWEEHGNKEINDIINRAEFYHSKIYYWHE